MKLTRENVIARIDQLLSESGMTDYQLTTAGELSSGTLSNIRSRKSSPTVDTMAQICKGLDISMSEFFSPFTDSETKVKRSDKETLNILVNQMSEEQLRRLVAYADGIMEKTIIK